MKVTVMPIVIGTLGTVPKGLGVAVKVENWRTSREHPDYSIATIAQNTGKSPRDLRRLSITQTSERLSATAGMKNSQGV